MGAGVDGVRREKGRTSSCPLRAVRSNQGQGKGRGGGSGGARATRNTVTGEPAPHNRLAGARARRPVWRVSADQQRAPVISSSRTPCPFCPPLPSRALSASSLSSTTPCLSPVGQLWPVFPPSSRLAVGRPLNHPHACVDRRRWLKTALAPTTMGPGGFPSLFLLLDAANPKPPSQGRTLGRPRLK